MPFFDCMLLCDLGIIKWSVYFVSYDFVQNQTCLHIEESRSKKNHEHEAIPTVYIQYKVHSTQLSYHYETYD